MKLRGMGKAQDYNADAMYILQHIIQQLKTCQTAWCLVWLIYINLLDQVDFLIKDLGIAHALAVDARVDTIFNCWKKWHESQYDISLQYNVS